MKVLILSFPPHCSFFVLPLLSTYYPLMTNAAEGGGCYESHNVKFSGQIISYKDITSQGLGKELFPDEMLTPAKKKNAN